MFFLNFCPAHWPGGIMGGAGFGVGLGSFENQAMGWVCQVGVALGFNHSGTSEGQGALP